MHTNCILNILDLFKILYREMRGSNERTVTSFLRAGMSGNTLTDARRSVAGASKVCCSGSIERTGPGYYTAEVEIPSGGCFWET